MQTNGVDCLYTSPTKSGLPGTRILAVDDNEDHRSFLSMLLQFYGASVEVAGSANEAFNLFLEFRPQVLVIDLAMPSIDGFGLFKIVRRTEETRGWQETPAIAITALAVNTVRQEVQQTGYEALLSKPIDIDTFLSTIASLAASPLIF
jgi:CheY-like chemotaxis protein